VEELSWDLPKGEIVLTLSSLQDQDLALIVRQGIASIEGPAGVIVGDLPQGQPGCRIKLRTEETTTLRIKLLAGA